MWKYSSFSYTLPRVLKFSKRYLYLHMCQMFIVSLTIWCISSITFHLDVFFSAYISELRTNIFWSSTFAHTGLVKNWQQNYKQLTISTQITFTFQKKESPVPGKTSAASRSFVLGHPPHHQIHGHRSLRAGVKNDFELRSNPFSFLHSPKVPTHPCVFLIPSSKLKFSLLCSWLIVPSSTFTFTQFVG